MWRPADLWFLILDDGTDHPVVTAQITTPDGVISVMAEVQETGAGRGLLLSGLHMQSERIAPNAIGAANLRVLAQTLLERMDLDELIVEGAVRTTGANPGRRPGIVRFRRRVRPAPD